MDVTKAISRINYALRGLDDDAPAVGSDEWNYWLDTLNRKKDELYEDVTKRWSNTYEVRSLGTITASVAPVYDLPDDFLAPSGDASETGLEGTGAYVITTAGTRVNLTMVKPEERNPNSRAVFIAGFNPEKLYFTDEIRANEQIVGGTLYLPGYWMPADLTEEDDVLPFLDPNWGVMSSASEIAFSDIVYEEKATDINAKANALFRQMVAKNKRGTYGRPRKIPTSMYRIGGPTRSR